MKYNAVIFDLFGTLIEQFREDFFEESLNKMAEAIGMEHRTYFNYWVNEMSHKRHTGAFPSIKEEIKFICKNHKINPSEEAIKRAVSFRYEFTKACFKPRKDALSVLKTLKKMRLHTGLVSDCSREVPELWPKLPFDPYLDTVIFSCEVGLKKPDPKIFKLACKNLDIVPEECIYIGDGFSNELTGSQKVGMRPFMIREPDDAEIKFKEWEGHIWQGEKIRSLSEIVDILKLSA